MQELPVGEDGLILIGGGQVMKGYLDAPEKTAEVIVEIDGVRYYKTGDKGHIDHNGFITMWIVILDLLKSARNDQLGSVEEKLSQVFDEENQFVAVALSDDKKRREHCTFKSNLRFL